MQLKFSDEDDGTQRYRYIDSALKPMDSHSHGGASSFSDPNLRISIAIALPGFKHRRISIQSKASRTVFRIKLLIFMEARVPQGNQRLFFNGVELQNDDPLSKHGVTEGSTLCAIFSTVRGDSGVVRSLIVETPDREVLSIAGASPRFTVWEIKVLISSMTNFAVDGFLLRRDAELVDDSMTIGDFERSGSVVFHMVLFPSPPGENDQCDGEKFQISVHDCDGIWKPLSLFLSTSNTVSELKEMIGETAKVDPDDQVVLLFHGENADLRRLDHDEKTLKFYGMKESSSLWFAGPSLKLFVKMPQLGSSFSIKLYGSATIGEVKKLILEKTDIPLNRHNLLHNGKLLEDEGIRVADLLAYSNHHNGTVSVHAIFGMGILGEKLNLKVGIGETVHEIEVESWFSMADVKAVIESVSEFPIGAQRLSFDLSHEIKDWETVSDYGSYDLQSFPIYVEAKGSPVEIFVNLPNGKGPRFALHAENSDTAHEIIDRIMGMIPRGERQAFCQQPCLFLNNDVRLKGCQMLARYGIESVCHLFFDRLIRIDAIRLNGTHCTVDLTSSYTIRGAEARVREACGVPDEFGVMLTYLGDEIGDRELSLGELEAVLGSLWVLRWKFGGCFFSFFCPTFECGDEVAVDGITRPMKVGDLMGYNAV